MNYFDFLNKKLTQASEQPQSGGEVQNTPKTQDEGSLFMQSNFAQESGDGSNIFTLANSDQLKEVDYDNIFTKEQKETNGLGTVLRDFFSFDSVKTAADKDGDGEISAEEAKAYIETVSAKDGKADSLTMDDLQAVIDENNINLEEVQAQAENPTQVQDIPPTEQFVQAEQTPEVQEEQPAQQTQAEAPVSDEVTTNIPKSDEKVLKVMEKINENSTKLDVNAVNINNKEVEISEQESVIDDLTKGAEALDKTQEAYDKQLSDLKSSLDKLGKPTGKPEDAEKDAKLEKQKTDLKSKIKAKDKEIDENKKAISDKKKALKEANKKLESLKKDLEKLNEEKTKLEEKKTKLSEEKAKLEEDIAKNCTEATKAKMEAYEKAVKNVDTVKVSEFKSAKTARDEAMSAVKEVDAKIATAKNRPVTVTSVEGFDMSQIPESERSKMKVSTLENGAKVLTYKYTHTANLQPELQDYMNVATQVAQEMGYEMGISDGYRSIAESNAARARKGNMVAPGGQSPHNYGAAFDFALYKNGKSVGRSEIQQFVRTVQDRVKSNGGQLDWGGDWKSKSYETWHVECHNWRQKYKH